jgi:tRNA threonylcarbamoyladenosine biosynthesis protein TsaE
MNICKSIIYSVNSIGEVASTIFLQYPDIIKWAFYAPMGAGKTTLIKALIKKLGSIDDGSSPTFAIANQYKTSLHGDLYHMDLFRLRSL